MTEPKDVPVVILAGGYGTRLMEETRVVPKPMVTIGGSPILLHIMRYYGSFGFRNFVICLGYKGHLIKDYFLNIPKYTSSLVIDGASGNVSYAESDISHWKISLVETGEHSLTGRRVARIKDYIDADDFCLTYGDGLCDLDLAAELAFHCEHGREATVTAVHYPSRFGKLEIEDGTVSSFKEKQTLSHDFINGGFFIFKKRFLDRLNPSLNQSLEKEPLSELASAGELKAFKHDGFWACMDTMRDRADLEDIYSNGSAPWARW